MGEKFNMFQVEDDLLKTQRDLIHYISELEEIIEFNTDLSLDQLKAIRHKHLSENDQLLLNSYAIDYNK
ncbi:hypothetical protein CPT_Silence33 [Bacillus phage Silence]|nr:hypothetical protein CPT_Silence33 [Bacillus phage Silence]